MSQKNKWIKDAKIKFISLVNKGANRKQFALKKSKDKKNLSFNIIKSEKKDWSIVKGIVYEPDVLDTDGQKMSAEEIQKMAHLALENGLSVDVQHDEQVTSCPVVESYIVEKDEDLNGQIVKKGSWVSAVKITDKEIKKAVDEGKINCFSMAGKAVLEDVEKSEHYDILLKFAEFLDETLSDSSMTKAEKKDDVVFNLAQFEEQILKSTDEKLNIKKTNVGAKMPELTEEKISEMIAKGVVEGIAKHEKAKEENLTKSADAKKMEDLQKSIDALKEKILGSDAGKDGAEGIKKADDEESESWL